MILRDSKVFVAMCLPYLADSAIIVCAQHPERDASLREAGRVRDASDTDSSDTSWQTGSRLRLGASREKGSGWQFCNATKFPLQS